MQVEVSMQTIQQPDQPTDPELATLQHIEKLLEKINEKLAFFVLVTIVVGIVSFLT